MKKYILTTLWLAGFWGLSGQSSLVQQAGHITFSDATFVVESGNIQLSGNLDFGTSTLLIAGPGPVTISGTDAPVNRLGFAQPNGGITNLGNDLRIKDSLFFMGSYNKLVLGDYDLTLSDTAGGISVTTGSFVVTNGNGQLRKANVGLDPYTFPVGFDTATFNPVFMVENGTPDTLGVRCLEHAFTEGCLGTPFSAGVVDASWEITEATPGGMDLDLTVQWAASDELAGFDRSFSGNGHYGTNGWDLSVDDCAAATGTGPYARERTGITQAGAFAVGNDSVATSVLVNIDLFLGGPYSGSGLMSDALRSGGHLPTGEPFDALGFLHHGFGGGENVAAGVFDVTGNDAIVDWLLVETRSGADSTDIKATTPALLQRDGDIVAPDGVSPLALPGIGEAEYWLVVKPRNHLGVMTASKLALSGTPTNFDFTLDPANAFGGTNALGDLGDGFFGLFPGDFNHNGQVQNTDVTAMLPTIGNSGYLQGDFDLNSQAQNTDLQLRLLPNVGKGVQYPNN